MFDNKLLELLDMVIDNYVSKWEPVGSKLLHSLEITEYAPSTLRKYLNILEKEWLVFQPYNSSGRIPTVQGLSLYLDSLLEIEQFTDEIKNIEVKKARESIKYIVELLWKVADGVVVWFLRNDEYYFLWINNLLRENLADEYENTRNIVNFIEEKKVTKLLDGKILKKNQIYYNFIEDWSENFIACLYAKITVNEFDSIISIVWPRRMCYKKNIAIMKKVIDSISQWSTWEKTKTNSKDTKILKLKSK